MPQDYNKTLNLPNTDFPMRAGLPQREPEMLQKWEESKLYDTMIERGKGKPLYVFHDGPPYANAAIHLGTALNKCLKDFIVRYKNMTGYLTHYVPGWDTHGLPIELKAIKEHGLERTADPVELRKHCHDFALYHVENQKKQFKRLGTLADYDHPYLTLAPKFEAKQIEIFGAMAKKGYIYKDLKSVYWCPECTTALAEAEIEYADDRCDSIYVKFQLVEDNEAGALAKLGIRELGAAYVVIWTTTTWTLPANLATCIGPDFEYAAVQANGEVYLMAKERVEETMKAAAIAEYQVLASMKGSELEYVKYRHPFLDRVSPLILGDHVTLDSGTGCVHTAPGHGVEDFEVCAKFYPELGCVVPVDDHGKMTAEAGDFIKGLPTEKANPVILEHIKDSGHLLAVQPMEHQYPHCWRCKEPILFRATEQWFCSVEDFKKETLEAVANVKFIPEWGQGRMAGMVQDRNAWCISRQRVWGVPIPVFYCEECGEQIINDESIDAVRALFEREGSDAWYIRPASEILPEDFVCPHCAAKAFRKESDIMDVWFDSGVSHAAVLEGDWPNQAWPCDLYLEGSDQYRGWFQSALLTAVAWRGVAPYKAVCTHGWVVDGEGRKMSKSLGNGIEPEEIIEQYGADILRLWVASSDYHADIRISGDILKQLSEAYRKIRNTARYILGNLYDFRPDTDCVSDSDLTELDRWALMRLDQLVERCCSAYDHLDFHVAYHSLHNFCTVDLSNFYLDIIKDRLYVEKADSVARRAAQTAMWRILRTLDLLLAPILSFTADEIWGYLPHAKGDAAESVVFNEIPKPSGKVDAAFMARWDRLISIRSDVNKALEAARNQKMIGKSLEAHITLHCTDDLAAALERDTELMTMLCIVSELSVVQGEGGAYTGETAGLSVTVAPAAGDKCERCWMITPTVGRHGEHPKLCDRCASIMDD